MNLFSKNPIKKTESTIEKLFKDSKITKDEQLTYLSEIEDIKYTKNLKFGNAGKYKTMLQNLDNELLQKDKEIIKIQKLEENIQTQPSREDLELLENLQEVQLAAPEVITLQETTVESSYAKIKILVDQFQEILGTKEIKGFDKKVILKSIGDPRYLELVKGESQYQEELSYLVEQSDYDNFEDIAFFLKEKNEEVKLNQVLSKHLKNASRVKMMRIVSKVYETTEQETSEKVANIYLNKGDYLSAREVYPQGKLRIIALINCAEISKKRSDYLSSLKCYAELEKEILMQEMIHAIIKHSSVFEAKKSIQEIPIAQPVFKKVLRELIKNEKLDSRILIQIKNLFKETLEYKKSAELFARRLFKIGDHTQGIEIMQLQEVVLSQELLGFILSEFEIQISQKNILKEESIYDLCEFLIAQGNEKIVMDKEKKIKEYYYQNGTKEGFTDFNLLLWNIYKKKKNLIENAA